MIFVHGGAGSGAQFESQTMRFTSNGYPESFVTVLEYDSTFSLNTTADVHARLDQLIADLKQQTGRAQVDILGHSLGTTVMHAYLNSSVARAADVAHYVNIDGRTATSPPGGVPTLAIWAGVGTPGRTIGGATNVTIPNQTHVQSATSAESFAEFFEFFTGQPPATTDVEPEPPGQVEIVGRAVIFPLNIGVEDAALELWELHGDAGRRKNNPATTVAINGDGSWGRSKPRGASITNSPFCGMVSQHITSTTSPSGGVITSFACSHPSRTRASTRSWTRATTTLPWSLRGTRSSGAIKAPRTTFSRSTARTSATLPLARSASG